MKVMSHVALQLNVLHENGDDSNGNVVRDGSGCYMTASSVILSLSSSASYSAPSSDGSISPSNISCSSVSTFLLPDTPGKQSSVKNESGSGKLLPCTSFRDKGMKGQWTNLTITRYKGALKVWGCCIKGSPVIWEAHFISKVTAFKEGKIELIKSLMELHI